MSESGCQSLQQNKSRFGKGDLEKDINCGFPSSRSKQNMNICADITNTPLVLHDKERNDSMKTEISVQSALKNNDGTVSPVLFQEHLPPMPHEIQFLSPDCHSESNILGISNMPISYFTDPTVPNENEQERVSAQICSINCDKYFSTPMPSKERVRKKLTPVMEVDFESNMSEEWYHQDKVPRIDKLHKADVLSHESPTETPLYRSFFAAECQEIVNQIENIETEVTKSPGKRKVEEFDVSTIDSEPPPYDCTPMESMLACEVAKMLCSLESSPLKEGVSLFGDSLLDLEKTDMQINDFNLSQCGTKNNKVHSLSETEELSFLSDRLDGVCIKRQKVEPLEKTYPGVDPVDQINKMFPLPNVVDPLVPEVPTQKPVHSYATSKCDESVTTVLPKNIEHTLSDNETEPVVLVENTAVVQNVSQVIKASLQALITTTRSPTPLHEGITKGCIRQFIETGERRSCASTTQDIALTYDEQPSTDITHETEANKSPPNTRQSFTSILDEMNIANATQMIEILPHTFNKTQDIPCSQEEVNISNTTRVSEMVGLPSGSTTQDIDSVTDDIISGNTTQVIDVLPLSANITQDISLIPEVVTANATQIIETGPQCPVNTTQDLTSMHENKTANTTHEMEIVPQSCLNATQDIISMPEDVLTANTTQDIEVEPQSSANRAQSMTSTPEEIITSCIQDVGVMQASSVEVLSAEKAASTHCTDAAPKELDSPHSAIVPANNVIKPSLNMVLEVPAQHSAVIRNLTLPSTTEISVLNGDYDLNAENKKDLVTLNDDKNVSKLDPTQGTLVVTDVKELSFVEPEAQPSVVTIHPSSLVSPPAQAIQNVTEGHKLEGYEKNDSNRGVASSQNEVDIPKESRAQPLLSESSSMIQEEENVHDVSVFSVGSLSFVTSTPVPGLNDFQFQKTCREPVQHDPNMSSGSVFDYSTNKVHGDQRMITQRSHVAQELNCNDKGKRETSQRSFFPPSMQRSMVPPSEAMPKQTSLMSGIPSARRSLALHQNTSQNPAREPTGSKIAPRGIPGKGMIRPPMARQSLPRPSLGNPKQAMEGTGGGNITNKFTGNRLRTLKASAVVKVKPGTTHSQLPTAPSVKPLTRFGVAGHTGRLSVGGQNALANLQDTRSGETVLAVRPPISAGVRTSLPRAGTSLIRPPLPQSQKVSPKLKCQGLPTKKNQSEVPTLGFRKEIGLKAESTSAVKSTAKQATPSLDVAKEATSFEAGIQASASPNHALQTKAENHDKVHSSLTSKEETASSPTISTELAESRHESCQHLEICKCCHVRYHKLLQENEDLKRRLGQVLPTQMEVSHMAGTYEELRS